MSGLELWAGAECTVNRVGDAYFDQVERTRAFERLEDIDRLAELGVRAVRFPVLWERVAPNPRAAPDFTWTDVRLERLRELGIRPIVGLLHHGSGPPHTDLCADDFVSGFSRYASAVARRYPWVEDYTPINEPLTTARFSALYGHWYPHRRDTASFLRALLNQIEGTAAAMREIRSVNSAARLVQTDDCGSTRATPELAHQESFENLRRWLSYDLLFGRVDRAHPLREHLLENQISERRLDALSGEPCPPDVVGLNYYLTSDRFLDHRLELYPRELWGGNGRDRYVDVEAVRVLPEGARTHRQVLLEAWSRYGAPVALTEVHLGCSREQQLRWLRQAWDHAVQARREGADVRAVTLWSLFGSLDWNSLVTRDSGHYESGAYDVRGGSPRPTALATLAAELARGSTTLHPLADGEGWWQVPARLFHALRAAEPSAPAKQPSMAAPLLVIGAGRLTRSVLQVCHDRGVATCAVGSDFAPGDLKRLTSVRPWAVVFTGQPTNARRMAVMLSALSPLISDLPVLAFSSDLVFDGRAGPYVETDCTEVVPEGRIWCEWEGALGYAVPHALVVRSGPWFDPALPGDALSRALVLLRRGEALKLPDQERISPAYAPHLLHGALDLLADGAQGVWHLAPRASCSPFDLLRAAAEHVGIRTHALTAGNARHVGLARGGHSSRALSSTRGSVMPDLHLGVAEYAARFRARQVA